MGQERQEPERGAVSGLFKKMQCQKGILFYSMASFFLLPNMFYVISLGWD